MLNLKKLLKAQSLLLPKEVLVLGIIFALVGFVDATYLTVAHYANFIPPCSIGGCEVVTTSSYSVILGVPLALIGALYYLFILVMFVHHIDKRILWPIQVISWVTTLGVIGYLYLFYVQVGILKAICIYCMLSSAMTALLCATISSMLWTLESKK